MPTPVSSSPLRLQALLVPGAILAVLPWFTHMAVAKLLWAGLVLVSGILAWALGSSVSQDAAGPVVPKSPIKARLVAFWHHELGVGRILLLLYLLCSLPAWFRWDNDWTTLRQAVLGAHSLLLFGWVALTPAQSGLRHWVQVYFLWALVLLAGVYGAEASGLSVGVSAVSGGATLGNSGLVGEMAGLGVLLVAWGLKSSGRWQRVGRMAVVTLLLAVVLSSGSLTGAAALAAGLIAWLVSWLRKKGPAFATVVVAGFVAACTALFLLLPTLADGLERRLYLYRIGWDVACLSPWFGSGVGSFARLFLDAQGDWLSRFPEFSGWWSQIDSAHCLWLNVMSQQGLPAALALAGLFGWVAVRFWRAQRHAELAVWVALVTCVSGSIGFETVAMRLMLALWAGLAFRTTESTTLLRPLKMGLAAAALMLVVPVLYVATVDNLVGKGDAETALSLAPFHAQARFGRAQLWAAQGNVSEAAEDLRRAEKAQPSVAVRMELARTLYLAGKSDEAEAWWLAVTRWHRTFMPAYANLAVLYAETGKAEQARRFLARARSLRPSDPRILRIERHIKKLLERSTP